MGDVPIDSKQQQGLLMKGNGGAARLGNIMGPGMGIRHKVEDVGHGLLLNPSNPSMLVGQHLQDGLQGRPVAVPSQPVPVPRKPTKRAAASPTAGYKVCVGCHNKIHNRVRKCPTCGVFNYPKGTRLPGTRGWRVCEKCNNTSVFVGKHAPQEKCNVVDCGWVGPPRKERKDSRKKLRETKPSIFESSAVYGPITAGAPLTPMHQLTPQMVKALNMNMAVHPNIQIRLPQDQHLLRAVQPG